MSDKKKADYGKGRTPGHFCVLPQRAVIDKSSRLIHEPS